MKYPNFVPAVILILCFSMMSCVDMFNNKEISIGTHELILFHSSDNPGFFLGKEIGNGNIEIIMNPSVLDVKGNDSILLTRRITIDSDTIYNCILLSKLGRAEALTTLEKVSYNEIYKKLKIKYNASTGEY